MVFDLSNTNVVDYLASCGLVKGEQVESVELLGWGVSNTLVKVCCVDDCLVVKQSLARLRVTDDWFADRERIYRECAGIRALTPLLPPGSLPQVRYEDRDNFLFVMSCAPTPGANWKEQLLRGEVDTEVARQVGAALGLIHRQTRNMESVRQEFIDTRPFIQLRIDPYHGMTARAHPDVAEVIDREARRMLDVKTTLTHGDYSPKNVIVTAAGQSSGIFLLDFEVIHYGSPVFDISFMLNHLFLKSIYNTPWRTSYFAAIDCFWRGYLAEASIPAEETQQLERDTVKQLGCLMLARIDGKSPAEYITHPAVKELTRRIAKTLLREDYFNIADVVALVNGRLEAANPS